MRTRMSRESWNARFHNARQRIRDGENLRAAGERDLETIRQWAREDGLTRELRELEHPPKVETPKWEATQRVRVLRACSISSHNPYGETEQYMAGVDSVVEWPRSVVKRLGDRVEAVPDDTPLVHVSAPVGTPTGDRG